MADKIVNYNDISKVRDMATLNLLRENFDKDFEKQKKTVETLELAKEMGSKKFGCIKESFENMSPELFKTKEGRVIMAKYIACIKESEELSKMHLLYECVRKANKDVDVNAYINEAVSMIGPVDINKYNESTRKLGKVLGEACEKLGCDKVNSINNVRRFATENDKLNEAVEYVGTHKKTARNLAEYTQSCMVIKEFVDSHEAVNKLAEHASIDIEKSINEFNEKYGKELDEAGQNLVKELLESTDKESIFNKYKDACLSRIKEKQGIFENDGDKMSSERLGIILEKVNKKGYNPETVNTDVFNLVEMTNSLQ